MTISDEQHKEIEKKYLRKKVNHPIYGEAEVVYVDSEGMLKLSFATPTGIGHTKPIFSPNDIKLI